MVNPLPTTNLVIEEEDKRPIPAKPIEVAEDVQPQAKPLISNREKPSGPRRPLLARLQPRAAMQVQTPSKPEAVKEVPIAKVEPVAPAVPESTSPAKDDEPTKITLKVDSPKDDGPQNDGPDVDVPIKDVPKQEDPKQDIPKEEAPHKVTPTVPRPQPVNVAEKRPALEFLPPPTPQTWPLKPVAQPKPTQPLESAPIRRQGLAFNPPPLPGDKAIIDDPTSVIRFGARADNVQKPTPTPRRTSQLEPTPQLTVPQQSVQPKPAPEKIALHVPTPKVSTPIVSVPQEPTVHKPEAQELAAEKPTRLERPASVLAPRLKPQPGSGNRRCEWSGGRR